MGKLFQWLRERGEIKTNTIWFTPDKEEREPLVTYPLETHMVEFLNDKEERFERELVETRGSYCNNTRKGRKAQLWEVKSIFERDWPQCTFVGARLNIGGK